MVLRSFNHPPEWKRKDMGEVDLFRNGSLKQIPSLLLGNQQFSSQVSSDSLQADIPAVQFCRVGLAAVVV